MGLAQLVERQIVVLEVVGSNPTSHPTPSKLDFGCGMHHDSSDDDAMIATMRTTVTLDPDVERLIRDAMRERAISFKAALNEAVRIGLRGKERKRIRKFAQKTFRMGEGQEFRWDKALAVAEAIEDQELSRKLTLRK